MKAKEEKTDLMFCRISSLSQLQIATGLFIVFVFRFGIKTEVRV